jgi:hypothetical protein
MHVARYSAIVLMCLSAAAAAAQDKAATPSAEQFQALANEFNKDGFALRQATTDEERLKIAERVNERTLKLLALAEQYPKDPVALDALVQVIVQDLWMQNNTPHPGFGKNSPEAKAIGILQRDFVTSDRIADTTRRVQYGFRPENEAYLRAVLEKNPQREIKALACLRLGQFLNARLQRLDIISLQPAMAKRYEGLYGKEYLAALNRRDRAEALKEVEATFERAAKEFADVKLPWGGLTVGQKAEAELYELRNLSVGKPALEIAGTDQDGQPLKLSDYRGKVVLLYFWSEY